MNEPAARPSRTAPGPHVLVARLDNAGDVLLAGPAIRAVARGARRVSLLCGPAGRAAGALLPGVDEVLVFDAPWVSMEAPPVDRGTIDALVDRLGALAVDQAVVLTSFHQSPLPLALLLRLAGVPTIAAASVDYPGSLLDVRHDPGDRGHEVERALSLVATLGHRPARGDDGRLAVRRPLPAWRPFATGEDYVVVHPGASVPARGWDAERAAGLVDVLAERGWRVAVTGSEAERPLTALVAGPARDGVVDLGGRTDLAGLAGVLEGAAVVVCGNTGPAHLAAAVGTPVVSIFAPVVPAERWRPWGVPTALLGDQAIACAGCRARTCPFEGQPCLADVTVEAAIGAVEALAAAKVPAALGAGGLVNILVWHVHGSYTTALVEGPHTYLFPVLPDRGPNGRGRAQTWDWPPSAVEVSPADLATAEVDLVVLQRPDDEHLANAWLGGRRVGRNVPAVWLEHNAPQGRIAALRHPAADRDDLTVVHVTPTNALFWDTGTTRVRVIEHGVIDPGDRYSGELPRAAVAVNEPRRRGRVTGTDLLPALARTIPIDLFGLDVDCVDVPGVRPHGEVPQHRLHEALARRRVYLHPVRWTSLGLTLIEAMLLGMPVVALATLEVPDAVPADAGVVSNHPEVLAAALRRYVDDPEAARLAGKAARTAALERYGLGRFLSDWNALFSEVTR